MKLLSLRFTCILFIIAGLMLCYSSVWAIPITYVAYLDGPSENPPNASPGTGRALVVIDLQTELLLIQATFSGLLSPVTVAHIHAPTAPPNNVGVAVSPGTLTDFPAGVTSGNYWRVFDLSDAATYTASFMNNFGGGEPAGAAQALAEALANGEAYFNIHTTRYPGGEIRGFFAPVPEPATAGLMALGIAGLGAVRTYRRRQS